MAHAVMHAGIANWQFPLKLEAEKMLAHVQNPSITAIDVDLLYKPTWDINNNQNNNNNNTIIIIIIVVIIVIIIVIVVILFIIIDIIGIIIIIITTIIIAIIVIIIVLFITMIIFKTTMMITLIISHWGNHMISPWTMKHKPFIYFLMYCWGYSNRP